MRTVWIGPPNYLKAVKWYRQAAMHGNPVGQYNLGVMYYGGKGIKKDFAKATKWFGRAANQDFSPGQVWFAHALWLGEGIEKDTARAIIFYNKATSQGNGSGAFSLGLIYSDQGDEVAALKAFDQSLSAYEKQFGMDHIQVAKVLWHFERVL